MKTLGHRRGYSAKYLLRKESEAYAAGVRAMAETLVGLIRAREISEQWFKDQCFELAESTIKTPVTDSPKVTAA